MNELDLLRSADPGGVASTVIALVLSYAFALPVAWDRESRVRSAGLRTFPLVSMASCGFVMLAHALLPHDPTAASRALEGLITGIGFLGAGTIIRVGDWIRGLTTAASIWYVAALGVVAGQGQYVLAVGGAAIGVAVLTVLDRVEDRIPSAVYHGLEIDVTPEKRIAVQGAITDICRNGRIRIQLRGWASGEGEGLIRLRFMIRRRGSIDIDELASQIVNLPGVKRLSLE